MGLLLASELVGLPPALLVGGLFIFTYQAYAAQFDQEGTNSDVPTNTTLRPAADQTAAYQHVSQ